MRPRDIAWGFAGRRSDAGPPRTATGRTGERRVRQAPSACRRFARVVAICGLVAGSDGCTSTHENLKAFLRADEHKVSASDYRIAVPDVLLISAPGIPEIDGDSQPVRTDGMISLRLLGEVRVVGLTPLELSAKLEEMLKRYYHEPKVHVRVGGYNSKKFYVMGEVGAPGPHPYTGRDTLMEVLARAQPTSLAWKSQIKVIRPSADKSKKREIVIDVDKMVQSGDMRMNILLQEGDIVYVPPTPLAWVGLRLREILWPVEEVSHAYAMPAAFIGTTDYYRDRFGRNDDDDEEYKVWRDLVRRWR